MPFDRCVLVRHCDATNRVCFSVNDDIIEAIKWMTKHIVFIKCRSRQLKRLNFKTLHSWLSPNIILWISRKANRHRPVAARFDPIGHFVRFGRDSTWTSGKNLFSFFSKCEHLFSLRYEITICIRYVSVARKTILFLQFYIFHWTIFFIFICTCDIRFTNSTNLILVSFIRCEANDKVQGQEPFSIRSNDIEQMRRIIDSMCLFLSLSLSSSNVLNN